MTLSSKNPTTVRPGLLIALAAGCLLLGTTGGAVAGGVITGGDIKDNTVTSNDIRDRTVKSRDLAAQAAARVSEYAVIDTSYEADPNEQDIVLALNCDKGKKVLGTSGYWVASNYAVQVFIRGDGKGAVAYTSNPNSVDPDTLHLRLTCAKVSAKSAFKVAASNHK